MKVVIDIPDEDYEYCKQFPYVCMGEWIINSVFSSIKHGTVLPKGHGDLIDRQAIIDNGIEKGFCDWYDEIKYAPTVVEADKESGND